MYKICSVCGNGLGSSLIIEMTINDALEDLGLKNKFEVSHTNLNSYDPTNNYDFIVCARDLAEQIKVEGKTKKIVLNNILDKETLISHLKSKL